MGVSDWILRDRIPLQVLYFAENEVRLFQGPGKKAALVKTFANPNGAEIGDSFFSEIKSALQPQASAAILSSFFFIFNLFEFDKLPWQTRLKKELVDWRLQKIFPENIEAYHHDFFRLEKNRIFSVLVRKNLVEKLRILFDQANIALTYIGNSTLEILNNIRFKTKIDFLVEIDHHFAVMVFFRHRTPIYLRKFKTDSISDLGVEILKTVQFVKNNYPFNPQRFLLVNSQIDSDPAAISAELNRAGLVEIKKKQPGYFFLPGYS